MRARCGFQRAYLGPDIHEWFDISDSLVKRINESLVKLSIEWKCFSFLILWVPIILFLNTIGRNCGFTDLHNFLSPTHKIKTQDNYTCNSSQLDIFYLLRLLLIWIKSLLVLFLEHFIKISSVDVSCAFIPYLSELKVGSLFFSPYHTVAFSWQQIRENLFPTSPLHLSVKKMEKYNGNHLI